MNSNEFLTHVLEYLKNEPKRHFGDLDSLTFNIVDDLYIIEQLQKILDLDSYFFLEGKLFSRVITDRMAQFDKNLQEDYNFQQNLVAIFKEFYSKSRENGNAQLESEQKAAKILWNLIENNQYEGVSRAVLNNFERKNIQKRTIELLKQYKVAENLIKMVQTGPSSNKTISSEFQQLSELIRKSIEAYKEHDYNETIFLFETTLNRILKHERKEIAVKFSILAGTLLTRKDTSVSKGFYFLKRAQKLCEELGDNQLLIECFSELSNAFWTQGMYKETLDILSTEIENQSRSKDTLGIMFSEEKLGHFFRNLSRFNESKSWAQRHLNSAIRSTNHTLKAFYFLDANINYANTLIGLNSWEKAEKHIEISEKTLNHLEISPYYLTQLLLEIHSMRGYMAVVRGKFKEAKIHFNKRNEYKPEIISRTPIFGRFLRSEAMLYRNQQEFSKAIHILQPLFRNKDKLNPLNVAMLAEILALHSHETEALKLLKRAVKVLKNWNSIHGLSRIYLSLGYVYFLMGEFSESKKWYNETLECIRNELKDLKVVLDAHTTLAYMFIENENFKLAESHCDSAEEYAIMSGSKAFILDSYLLKAVLMTMTGKGEAGINAIRRISNEALESEIAYIYRKSKIQLNRFI